jgi:hypothetical protein
MERARHKAEMSRPPNARNDYLLRANSHCCSNMKTECTTGMSISPGNVFGSVAAVDTQRAQDRGHLPAQGHTAVVVTTDRLVYERSSGRRRC